MKHVLLWTLLIAVLLVLAAGGFVARGGARLVTALARKEIP